MNSAYQIALHHHEKWDGSGYPAGLKAAEISIEGRICAIADVFDALTSVRPYKEAWSIDRALAFIDGESGKHFDPDLTKRLREILPQMLVIKDAFSDVLS